MPVLTRYDPSTGTMVQVFDEARIYKWFAEQIWKDKRRVAELCGIRELAWLDEVRPPEPLPSWEAMEEEFKTHCRCSDQEKQKVISAWNDFRSNTGISSIRDITPLLVVQFRDAVYGRGLSGKFQAHIFGKIRRFLRFIGHERAQAVGPINKALDALKVLKPNESTVSLDPNPVDPADYQKLLANAEGDDRAMLLLMLNCALYLGEVIDLRWDDVKDGQHLVAHRRKTGKVVRVACLWPETIKALANVKRRGEYILINREGAAFAADGARWRFDKIRVDAGVNVTSSQLRDGALTAASAANVNQKLVSLLAGHRAGIADHYVKRNPSQVRPATDAVHAVYFGESKVGPRKSQ